MEWKDVGQWLKDNGTGLLGLAGAVATGNIPAGVAAVATLVSEATGKNSPAEALAALQTDPATMIKLKELAARSEQDIRMHHRELLRLQLEDGQKEQAEQQETIRSGDNAADEYVRHTRPLLARQSWWGAVAYTMIMEICKVYGHGNGADPYIIALISSPSLAYMGFRTWDKKIGGSWFDKISSLAPAK